MSTYDDFSHGQKVALAILPKFSSIFSLFGSIWIVIEVLTHKPDNNTLTTNKNAGGNGERRVGKSNEFGSKRSRGINHNNTQNQTKRNHPYHRLLFAMSIYDILESIWNFMSTWPIPKESNKIWAVGSIQTCSTQGFFLMLSIAVPIYNSLLAVYYLLVIKYQCTDQILQKRVEPTFHIIAGVWSFFTALYAVSTQLYNDAGLWCWISSYPTGCLDSIRYGSESNCQRGDNAWVYQWIFYFAPLWLCIIMATYCTLNVYMFVKRLDEKTLIFRKPQYRKSLLRNNKSSNKSNIDIIHQKRQSILMASKSNSNSNSNSNEIDETNNNNNNNNNIFDAMSSSEFYDDDDGFNEYSEPLHFDHDDDEDDDPSSSLNYNNNTHSEYNSDPLHYIEERSDDSPNQRMQQQQHRCPQHHHDQDDEDPSSSLASGTRSEYIEPLHYHERSSSTRTDDNPQNIPTSEDIKNVDINNYNSPLHHHHDEDPSSSTFSNNTTNSIPLRHSFANGSSPFSTSGSGGGDILSTHPVGSQIRLSGISTSQGGGGLSSSSRPSPTSKSGFVVGPENSAEMRRLSIISQLTMELEEDRMDDEFLAGRYRRGRKNQQRGDQETTPYATNRLNNNTSATTTTHPPPSSSDDPPLPSRRSMMIQKLRESASQHLPSMSVRQSIDSFLTRRQIYRDDYPRTVAVLQQACWYLGTFYITHVWSTTNRILQVISVASDASNNSHIIRSRFVLSLIHSWFDPFQGFLNYCVYQRPRFLFIRKSMPEIGRIGAAWRVIKFSFQKQKELLKVQQQAAEAAAAAANLDNNNNNNNTSPNFQHHHLSTKPIPLNSTVSRRRRSSSSMLGLSRNSIVSSVNMLNSTTNSVMHSIVAEEQEDGDDDNDDDDDDVVRRGDGKNDVASHRHRSGQEHYVVDNEEEMAASRFVNSRNGVSNNPPPESLLQQQSLKHETNSRGIVDDNNNDNENDGEAQQQSQQQIATSSSLSNAEISSPLPLLSPSVKAASATAINAAEGHDDDDDDDSIGVVGNRNLWKSWPSRRTTKRALFPNNMEDDDDEGNTNMHNSYGALSIGMDGEILPMGSL